MVFASIHRNSVMLEDQKILFVLRILNYPTAHKDKWFLPFEIIAFPQSH